jgi:hypothetical protein
LLAGLAIEVSESLAHDGIGPLVPQIRAQGLDQRYQDFGLNLDLLGGMSVIRLLAVGAPRLFFSQKRLVAITP